MNRRMTRDARYSHGAIALHWVVALLIILNVIAALVADTMPKPQAMQIMANHKSIGLAVLALSVLRVIWRLTHRPPPLSPALKTWEVGLAHLVHTLFYVLIIAIPLTGWMMVSSFGKGAPVSWFGLFDVPALPVPATERAGGSLDWFHVNLAWLTLALLVLHVAGALKHQLLDCDGTLARMIPFLRRPEL